MHSLVLINREEYRSGVEKIAVDASNNYGRVCYISFNDPHHIVIEMLKNIEADENKFIVIDASKNVKEIQAINKTTYVLNTTDLFDVYLFLRDLIKKEGINAILLDSISALIYRHNQLPLKEMLSNLLLDIGTLGCDSFALALKEHTNHEVLRHLNPLISRNMVL
jgi:hypothetical protein